MELTDGPDVFFSAEPNLCVRALGESDTLMVGPGGYVIGDSGDDTINAWGGGTVVPGPGMDTVAISSGGTVRIFDTCETPAGENLDGGGDGTLVTPVSVETLQSLGVIVSGFANIVIEQNSCLSLCVAKPDCSGHGTCAEGATAGEVQCNCDPGFSGPNCTATSPLGCPNGEADNGNPCDDGDFCTKNDTCDHGVCAGVPETCDPLDQCHGQGTCTPGVGCSNPVVPDGTSCAGNSNQSDVCMAGSCSAMSVTVTGAVPSGDDPTILLSSVDNPVLNGIDNLRVVSSPTAGGPFTEQAEQEDLLWAYFEMDLGFDQKGPDLLGNASRPLNVFTDLGLPARPDASGFSIAPSTMPFSAHGTELGYGLSLIQGVHSQVDTTRRTSSVMRVKLNPSTMLVPIQMIRVLPPPGDLFNALSKVTATQFRALFDDLPDMKRTTVSHPGGEVLADVEYKQEFNLVGGSGGFVQPDTVWAQCGIQWRDIPCRGFSNDVHSPLCPVLSVDSDAKVKPPECELNGSPTMVNNLNAARNLPGLRSDIPMGIFVYAASGDCLGPTGPFTPIDFGGQQNGGEIVLAYNSLFPSSGEPAAPFVLAHELGHVLGLLDIGDQAAECSGANKNLMCGSVARQSAVLAPVQCTTARQHAAPLVKAMWGLTIAP